MHTWQYSNIGSIICFQIVSSGARSAFEVAFDLIALLIEAMLSAGSLGIRSPISDTLTERRSSKTPLVGDNIAVGEKSESVVDLDDGSGTTDSMEKKLVTKAYSAVALSMRTSNNDRRSASAGSFYRSEVSATFLTNKNHKHKFCCQLRTRVLHPVRPPFQKPDVQSQKCSLCLSPPLL